MCNAITITITIYHFMMQFIEKFTRVKVKGNKKFCNFYWYKLIHKLKCKGVNGYNFEISAKNTFFGIYGSPIDFIKIIVCMKIKEYIKSSFIVVVPFFT